MHKFIKLAAIAITASQIGFTPTITHAENKLPAPQISEEHSIPRHEISVLGSTISYLEQGDGDTVLFIHGNPSSAYLWRNIIPYATKTHRAIAVDLIGMGHSGKPDIEYSYADHDRYLDAFIEKMDLSDITIVAHDWGAALAWDFARKNPDKVSKIAFMEGVLPPAFPQASYEAMGEEMGGMFKAMRDEVQGYEMIMEGNMFVNAILPQMINRPLGSQAREEYGAPYQNIEARLPTWAWPKEVPIGGEPAGNVKLMQDIESFMSETDMPVLLAYAEPGVLVPPKAVPYYTGLIKNIETSFVGQGLHFIQEDQPHSIGRAIEDWLRRN